MQVQSILAPWESFFAEAVVDAGTELADEGVVAVKPDGPHAYRGVVRQDHGYDVRLALRGVHLHADHVLRLTGLDASCTCAEAAGRCQHVAAVLARLVASSRFAAPQAREVEECRARIDPDQLPPETETPPPSLPATPAIPLAPRVDDPALTRVAQALGKLVPPPDRPREQRLAFVLEPLPERRAWQVRAVLAHPLRSGRLGVAKRFDALAAALKLGRALSVSDAGLLRWLMSLHDPDLPTLEGVLTAAAGATGDLLARLAGVGALHREDLSQPLALGPAVPAQAQWLLSDAEARLTIVGPDGHELLLLLTDPPWYLGVGAIGPCTGISLELAQTAVRLPAVPVAVLAQVATQLARIPGMPPAPPAAPSATGSLPVTGALQVVSGMLRWWSRGGQRGHIQGVMPLAAYGDALAPLRDGHPLRTAEGGIVLRDATREAELAAQLGALGLVPVAQIRTVAPRLPPVVFPPTAGEVWLHGPSAAALGEGEDLRLPPVVLAALAGASWRVIGADAPPPAILAESIEATIAPSRSPDWFDLRLGLAIGEEQVDLTETLLSLLAQGGEARSQLTVIPLGGEDWACVPLPGGRLARVRLALIERILEHLRTLAGSGRARELRLSAFDAVGWQHLDGVRAAAPAAIHALADRLVRLAAPAEAEPPPGLTAQLRPYQRRALAWLEGLAAAGGGGILADDMGLGKTVQAIAHLLARAHAGALTTPALVVAPASVLGTWRDECARFAPGLRVLVHHGPSRTRDTASFTGVQLVITSYATLLRDSALFESQRWAVVIADEAQVLATAGSKSAAVVRALQAGERLAMSGTPLSNHLGELHALVSWVVPGLLGTPTQFQRAFRTPIEEQGDQRRAELLRRRLAPFLLRRTKAIVAPELPPRTESVVRLTLEERQRELYDAIRLAMDTRIRAVLAARGLAGSRLEVLDCLTRLRLCCCDPRLVRAEDASQPSAGAPSRRASDAGGDGAAASAKLAWLRTTLPEMIEEGRRILLFSQFTSWLDLLEADVLTPLGLPWLRLDGSTTHRDVIVRRFQAREVPLFLLSLKAGGVGLTLTAADTVILADPWWNPAAEDQAADRAHRIGQDQPVFVYRLVCEGTVEDRILALQARKRALAEVLVDAEGQAIPRLDEAELAALLAPLPG